MTTKPDEKKQKYFECNALRSITAEGTARPGGVELTRRAVELAQLKAGARALDVGCGTGVSVELLRDEYGILATGIDPSPVMLETGLRRRSDLPICKGKAEELIFVDDCMDAIFSECCLSHYSDLPASLAEFRRVLSDSGRLLVSDIYIRERKGDAGASLGGFMDKQTIISQLEEAGFEVLIWEEHTQLLTQLAVSIVMKYGSMEKFWEQSCGDCGLGDASRNAKLGYYLLIARKASC